jgi:hypothetical protein
MAFEQAILWCAVLGLNQSRLAKRRGRFRLICYLRTFVVPWTGCTGGCGDSSAEREFPSDKVYRRDDRGIVGVETFSPQGLAFVVIHTRVGRGACCYGSPGCYHRG